MARTELLHALRQDARHALRLARRTPGFTAVAIATLALGIGATTAIFTLVDAVLLRPLRFAEAQRLAMVWTSAGSRVSHGYLHDWRLESRAFEDMAGWFDEPANLTGRGEPLEVPADRVTSNFFAVLGTPALVGRTFTTERTLRRVAPEVVLSHGLWQRRYGGDPAITGRTIILDGKAFTIVGVMPAGFAVRTVELAASRAELWMPFDLDPGDRASIGGALNVVGRLAPGVTPEQARTELAAIGRRIEQAHPSFTRTWGPRVDALHEATVRDVRLALLMLLGAVGILLLIACVNVANLVLCRTAARQTELAIRLSLGATRLRLVRQLLTESLVMAAAGGALGALLAAWGTRALVAALPAGLDMPRIGDLGVNARILAFTALVTIVTAIVCGLIPAINLMRSAPHPALRAAVRGSSSASSSPSSSSSGRVSHRVRGLLIVSEVALALILLAGAGLLGRSFWALSRVDPGFRSAQVITLRTTLPASRYDTADRLREFSRDLLQRVERLPGVRAAGTVGYLPMSRVGEGAVFDIEGRVAARPEDRPRTWSSVVGGRYFEVMGIPLLRGRLPGPADTDTTTPVFVIDETLARRYWPDTDPVGARLVWRRGPGRTVTGEIIGVVGRVHWIGLAADPQGTTYSWFPQHPGRQLTIVAKTHGDPAALAGAVASQVTTIDPSQPVADVRAMSDMVADDLAQPRFTMLLLGSFAGVALLIAAIGLYGVIAFSVAQRTREIGVRVAIGAERGDVLRLIMRRGLLLVALGLAIGTAAALALGRLVSGLLYGVTPTDPPTLLTTVCVLAIVALLATYVPARRATRVDPIVALRAE